jgi:hypothetical protein
MIGKPQLLPPKGPFSPLFSGTIPLTFFYFSFRPSFTPCIQMDVIRKNPPLPSHGWNIFMLEPFLPIP